MKNPTILGKFAMDKGSILERLFAMDEGSVLERLKNQNMPCEVHLTNKHMKDDEVIKLFKNYVKLGKIQPYFLHIPTSEHHHIRIKGQQHVGEYFITPMTVVYEDDRTMLLKVAKLAEYIGDIMNSKVTIVIHNDITHRIDKTNDKLEFSLVFLADLLDSHTNVNINIENLTAWNKDDIGYSYEGLEYIELFNKRYPHLSGRVNITFDTCHAIATLRRFSNNPDLQLEYMKKDFRKLFETQAKYITEIHLANALGYGIEKGQHAAPFDIKDKSSMETLNFIIDVLEDNDYNGTITIEVTETEYPESTNHLKEYKALYKVLKERNITTD